MLYVARTFLGAFPRHDKTACIAANIGSLDGYNPANGWFPNLETLDRLPGFTSVHVRTSQEHFILIGKISDFLKHLLDFILDGVVMASNGFHL